VKIVKRFYGIIRKKSKAFYNSQHLRNFEKSFIFPLPFIKKSVYTHIPQTRKLIMSKHNSLKASGSAGGKKSVMKRFERIKALRERGEWEEGRSPIGLPKTKVIG